MEVRLVVTAEAVELEKYPVKIVDKLAIDLG